MYHPRRATQQHPWLLTEMEWQIVDEICSREATIAELAVTFSLSPRTVQTHLLAIYGKLCVNSRVGVVLKVIADADARKRCFPQLTTVSQQAQLFHGKE